MINSKKNAAQTSKQWKAELLTIVSSCDKAHMCHGSN